MDTDVLMAQYSRSLPNRAESVEALLKRVVTSIAEVERLYGKSDHDVSAMATVFEEVIARNLFWPAGRVLNNAGSLQGQMASCFVLPLEDDFNAIFDTLRLAANCHRTGGGTGFDLSALRESGAEISTSEAAGASSLLSWLELFDSETRTVMSGGKMRGANLATLSVYHPDILDFIEAKISARRLQTFNLSVRVDDAFMAAVRDKREVSLVSPHTQAAVRRLPARVIWEAIIEGAWYTGDPGLLFYDQINRTNPLRAALGPILGANPCAEQLMYPYESSFLGSLNLRAFYDMEGGQMAWEDLERVITIAVRMLDNVIDLCRFPDERIAVVSRANRRIGLGIMGYADLLIAMGLSYGSR